jgi:hypothetical protein
MVFNRENIEVMARIALRERYLEEAKVAAIAKDMRRYEDAMTRYERIIGLEPTAQAPIQPAAGKE